MKVARLIVILITCIVFVSCSSSSRTVNSAQDDKPTRYMTLENQLKAKPGVFFYSGQLRVRGADQSFTSDNEPLFVINNQIFTGSYEDVKGMISPMEIERIDVLKTPNELAMYGVRGANGVIKIKLKSSKGVE